MSPIVAVIILGVYFLPTILALNRHQRTRTVFALNLLLGWTGIAWVVALVMALWKPGAAATRQA